MLLRALLTSLLILTATIPAQAATVSTDLSPFVTTSFQQGNPAVRFRARNTGKELYVGVPENGSLRNEGEVPYSNTGSGIFSILYTRATGVISASYGNGGATSFQMTPGATFNAMRFDIYGARPNGDGFNSFSLTNLVANGKALAGTLAGPATTPQTMNRYILWNFANLDGDFELRGTLNYTGPFGNAGGAEAARIDMRLGNVTPVPLPAAGWMLMASLAGLAALNRRRKAA